MKIERDSSTFVTLSCHTAALHAVSFSLHLMQTSIAHNSINKPQPTFLFRIKPFRECLTLYNSINFISKQNLISILLYIILKPYENINIPRDEVYDIANQDFYLPPQFLSNYDFYEALRSQTPMTISREKRSQKTFCFLLTIVKRRVTNKPAIGRGKEREKVLSLPLTSLWPRFRILPRRLFFFFFYSRDPREITAAIFTWFELSAAISRGYFFFFWRTES